jgi:hypothetical protein
MAFTQSQLIALEAAIAQGTTRVKYQDREVEYRSLAEMIQLLNMMKQELGLTSGKIVVKKAEFSKGL